MKRTDIYIRAGHDFTEIGRLVRGRVAHITCARNLRAIRRTGALVSNPDGLLRGGYGNRESGFFRRRDCVSVFDCRALDDEVFEDAWSKCAPNLAFGSCSFRIAILFLSPIAWPHLRSWREWEEEKAWDQTVVPYIEAGFPSPLPLSHIEELVVARSRPKSSPLLRALTMIAQKERSNPKGAL